MSVTQSPKHRFNPAGMAGLTLLPAPRRLLKHPRLMHYFRLITVVFVINAVIMVHGVAGHHWLIVDGSLLRAESALAVVNLSAAILIRQSAVTNVVFALAARVPSSWPLRIRWLASKIYHIGGVHVGAAVAGTAWMVAFTLSAATAQRRYPGSVPTVVLTLAWLLVALTVLIVVCALPFMRARAHNLFEHTHRLGGWTAVGLFWGLTITSAVDSRGNRSVVAGVVAEWRVWILLGVTAAIAWPWLFLRRVPVRVERPSSHAVIVSLDYGVTPPIGAAIGISRHPLKEWHTFASVVTPGRPGYRLLVSRVGDWTGQFIDQPPSHVWVRGIPIASALARVEALFDRMVFVATGSGIGPILGTILAARTPTRLVWSLRSPRATYGDALIDEVLAAQPDAVLWDTTTDGRVSVLELAQRAYLDFGAEAVLVVSNKPTTWQVVHGMERLGVPAIGPIFDS